MQFALYINKKLYNKVIFKASFFIALFTII